jgi:hypothetical protein
VSSCCQKLTHHAPKLSLRSGILLLHMTAARGAARQTTRMRERMRVGCLLRNGILLLHMTAARGDAGRCVSGSCCLLQLCCSCCSSVAVTEPPNSTESVAGSCYLLSGILLYMCPYTAMCVSSYWCMCPHTSIHVSAY